MLTINFNDYSNPSAQVANNQSMDFFQVRRMFDSTNGDLEKICTLWGLDSRYAQALVLVEFEQRIARSQHISELFDLLQILHRNIPQLRDYLGAKFQAKIDVFRAAGQTCPVLVWKRALPGLVELGLLEENEVFYKARTQW